MSVLREVGVLAALATPALLAPVLVRARACLPAIAAKLMGMLICLVPLGAPWVLDRTRASPFLVWLVAIAGAIVMVKAIDWLARPRHEGELLRVWLVLTFWPALQIEDVLVRETAIAERTRSTAWRILMGMAGLFSGLALTAIGHTLGMPERGFLLDKLLKTLEIYLLASGGNNVLVAGFALVGYRISDGFRYPILARSILDFWSRYNVCIHLWLKRNIFEPIGMRKRRPVLGILAVFGFSGLAHDYMFVPLTYELLGWQFAFFGLHGLGAIGSAALGRAYRAAIGSPVPRALTIAATMGFVLATAPIFIHCVDQVFDLHRDVGGWVLKKIGSSGRDPDAARERILVECGRLSRRPSPLPFHLPADYLGMGPGAPFCRVHPRGSVLMEVLACLNGEIMPVEQARVPVWDRGFLFGDSVYEVWRTYRGRLWLEAEHLARLRRSLKELEFPAVDLERLMDRLHRTNTQSGIQEGTVYVQITRGVAPRAHAFPDPPVPPTELILVRPYDDGSTAGLRETGAGMISHADLRWKRCDVKSTNLLGNVLAIEVARRAGCQEAVLLDPDGRVTEATHSSLIWVRSGRLEGTPEGHEILPGMTRQHVIRLAQAIDIPFDATRITLPELLSMDEVILFGTTIEVLPVVRIDDQTIGAGRPGPIARRLGAALHSQIDQWLAG